MGLAEVVQMADRNYILDRMKSRTMTIDEFDYERLWAPPLYSLLSVDDVEQLHKIATSIRYSGKPLEKLDAIDKIMRNRGFRKFGGGTNRVVYKFLEDDSFLVKVATCDVALDDSPREFINQNRIKPFCSKCFEVSPCGTVGVFERVTPIRSREEFLSVADMVYDLITNILIGDHVMDDIGSEYFMNYGVRAGFGVVILDYSYDYFLDGNKLYCNNLLPDGTRCGGVIDYDPGFNRLSCTKCGRVYKAAELKKAIDNSVVITKGGLTGMKVELKRGNSVVSKDTEDYFDTSPKLVPRKKGKKAKVGTLKISLRGAKKVVNVEDDEDEEPVHTLNARGTIVHSQVQETPDEKRNKEFDSEVSKLNRSIHGDDDYSDEEENEEYLDNGEEESDDEDYEEDNGDFDLSDAAGYDLCSIEVISSADIDGDQDNAFKGFVMIDSDGNYLGNLNGECFLADKIMGKNVDDVVILDKDAYQQIMDDLAETKAALVEAKSMSEKDALKVKLERVKEDTDEDDSDDVDDDYESEEEDDNSNDNEYLEEDDGLEYYIDEKGVPRWKTNHNVYKKPIPDDEPTYDTSSKFIEPKDDAFGKKVKKVEEDMMGTNVPVGAAPPKNKRKDGKRPKAYDDPDEEYDYDPNKIKNNGKKNRKK